MTLINSDGPRNPLRHPDRPGSVDTGCRLGTIKRSADEQICVDWCAYNGRPFVGIRIWKRGADGSWWPDGRRGLSVRLHELSRFLTAIAAATELAEASQAPSPHGAVEPHYPLFDRHDAPSGGRELRSYEQEPTTRQRSAAPRRY